MQTAAHLVTTQASKHGTGDSIGLRCHAKHGPEYIYTVVAYDQTPYDKKLCVNLRIAEQNKTNNFVCLAISFILLGAFPQTYTQQEPLLKANIDFFH